MTISPLQFFSPEGPCPSFAKKGALLWLVLLAACTLTQRKRVSVITERQKIELNNLVSPLTASDSLDIFNEETKKKDGPVLGEILYLRIFNSKVLPADNNLAEELALRVCKKIYPRIPHGNQYILWKLQFVNSPESGSLQLQKIFNFIPEELEGNPAAKN
ncbi:MAG: hypothetical protein JSS77_11860 [Acidobacteria bacterium]|nr:hypothetical protein [Acidobacteriota bacterium]MBS1927359.1 hypothetical protein [Bacteroidota bacterium]